jgi:hypothetical protein
VSEFWNYGHVTARNSITGVVVYPLFYNMGNVTSSVTTFTVNQAGLVARNYFTKYPGQLRFIGSGKLNNDTLLRGTGNFDFAPISSVEVQCTIDMLGTLRVVNSRSAVSRLRHRCCLQSNLLSDRHCSTMLVCSSFAWILCISFYAHADLLAFDGMMDGR